MHCRLRNCYRKCFVVFVNQCPIIIRFVILTNEVDAEILKLQNELLSDTDLQKLQNIYDNNYVNDNASIEGIASNLATYYMLYKDVNLINTEIEMYRSITKEEIQAVAKKFLNPNQRLVLDYVPTTDKVKKQ